MRKFFSLLLVQIFVASCGGSGDHGSCDPASQGCEQICSTPGESAAGVACEENYVCELPAESCDVAELSGVCVLAPEACPEIYQPVCGCDEETYGNDCLRLQAGVALQYAGSCRGPCAVVDCLPDARPVDTDGDGCDDTCEPGYEVSCSGEADCWWAEDLYCATSVGTCGSGDGICATRPEACTADVDPVCGCDGLTYRNPCNAAAQGVSVDAAGTCGDSCGFLPLPGEFTGCEPGQVCELQPGTCDVPDLPGSCVDLPQACPRIYRPVCGCDNQTYDNDCLRLQARVAQRSDGACPMPLE